MRELDYLHLEEAYNIAHTATGKTFPNPTVGAIITKRERVVSSGYHQQAGEAHAEAVAIDNADAPLHDATLYTTLEPCAYDGAGKRTPSCVSRIIEAGIGRVVIGARDPHARENGRSLKILRQHNIKVVSIDMNARFICQNEGYVVRMRHARPLIEIKLAHTIDGYSADNFNSSRWISDQGALRFAHHLRKAHGALLVGKNTALYDDPSLSVRFGLDAHPIRIVLDRALDLPLSLRVFKDARSTATYLAHDKKAQNEKKMRQLERMEVKLVACASGKREFLDHLFHYLAQEEICDSILIEGGATIVRDVIEHEIWDRVSFVISPTLLLNGIRIQSMQPQKLSDIRKIELSTWYSLSHFDSRCMVLRGYKNCKKSFGIDSEHYKGSWNV